MPLPNLTNERQCTARCRARNERCMNLRAFGSKVCAKHGAVKNPRRGKDHHGYTHGLQTKQAKAEKHAEAEMWAAMLTAGIASGLFPTSTRLKGRPVNAKNKPKSV